MISQDFGGRQSRLGFPWFVVPSGTVIVMFWRFGTAEECADSIKTHKRNMINVMLKENHKLSIDRMTKTIRGISK